MRNYFKKKFKLVHASLPGLKIVAYELSNKYIMCTVPKFSFSRGSLVLHLTHICFMSVVITEANAKIFKKETINLIVG